MSQSELTAAFYQKFNLPSLSSDLAYRCLCPILVDANQAGPEDAATCRGSPCPGPGLHLCRGSSPGSSAPPSFRCLET